MDAHPPGAYRRFSTLFYPFEGMQWERQWVALTLLNALLSMVFPPLAEMIEMGYAFQALRPVVVAGAQPAIPERLPWRRMMLDGLRWWLVSLVYNLAALLAFFATLGALLACYGLPEDETWLGFTRGLPLLALGLGVSAVLAVVGGWLGNIAAMNLIRRDRLAAAFWLGDWGSVLRTNLGGLIQAFGLVLVVSLGLGLVQLVLSLPAAALVVMPLWLAAFFSLYQRMMSAGVYARAFRAGIERRETAIPV
jgi:hypothetical protein